jgi:Major Facilitator Superfamily
LAVVLLVAFIAWEHRVRVPMLDVGLFRNLRFSAASGAVTITFFSLMGFIFLVTLYFQFLKGYSLLSTGVRLLPVATLTAITSVLGTSMAVRTGTKQVVVGGLLALAAALAWTSTASESTTYLTIAGQMVLIGSGIGLTGAPAPESIMGAVPPAKAGVGSAVNDATRILGGTLGVAVIGSTTSPSTAAGSRQRSQPNSRRGSPILPSARWVPPSASPASCGKAVRPASPRVAGRRSVGCSSSWRPSGSRGRGFPASGGAAGGGRHPRSR